LKHWVGSYDGRRVLRGSNRGVIRILTTVGFQTKTTKGIRKWSEINRGNNKRYASRETSLQETERKEGQFNKDATCAKTGGRE